MRHLIVLLMAVVVLATPLAAQPKNPQFQAAKVEWQALSASDRVRLQIRLMASGHWSAVPNQDLSTRLFEAMLNFQIDNDFPQTGMLDENQKEFLIDLTDPLLKKWGFRAIAHPTRKVPLWIPVGLGLRQSMDKEGLDFVDPEKRIHIVYKHYPLVTVPGAYRSLLNKVVSGGENVTYKVLRKDFFVIVANRNGVSRYIRYHADGNGLLGFAFVWNDKDGDLHGERVSTIMSSSLWVIARSAPFVHPPEFPDEPKVSTHPRQPNVASRPQQPQVAAVPVPTTPPAPEPGSKKEEEEGFNSGTGFFVSDQGHIVTNAHVIDKCSVIVTGNEEHEVTEATLLGKDVRSDLALLKTKLRPSRVATLRLGARLGEGVAVFGYPLSDVLSSSGNFTIGNVTALSGIKDDTRHFQISAPVQSGNSGGPLLDNFGNLIGVVVAKLNVLKVAAQSGEFAQNVNFAIKAGVAAAFLDSYGVTYQTNAFTVTLPPEKIAEEAKKLSVMVVCK